MRVLAHSSYMNYRKDRTTLLIRPSILQSLLLQIKTAEIVDYLFNFARLDDAIHPIDKCLISICSDWKSKSQLLSFCSIVRPLLEFVPYTLHSLFLIDFHLLTTRYHLRYNSFGCSYSDIDSACLKIS